MIKRRMMMKRRRGEWLLKEESRVSITFHPEPKVSGSEREFDW